MNCSKPAKTATLDLQAMNQSEKYVKNNPNATYSEVANHISWYWNHPDMSPYMADWITYHLLKMNKIGGATGK